MNEILEIIARAFLEFVFELLIRGPGWLFLRLFRQPEEIHPDGCLVPFLGLLVWGALGVLGWGIVTLF